MMPIHYHLVLQVVAGTPHTVLGMFIGYEGYFLSVEATNFPMVSILWANFFTSVENMVGLVTVALLVGWFDFSGLRCDGQLVPRCHRDPHLHHSPTTTLDHL